MTLEIVRVRASVQFLAASEDGRTSSIRGNYRPNHNFGDSTNREFWMGQIDLAEGDGIAPGESKEVEIKFWGDARLRRELSPGRSWRIQEGPKLVAYATVIEVLDAN